MFVNNLKIENDLSFTLFVGEVSINSYDIFYDKVVIDGEIKTTTDVLLDKPVVMRVSFIENAQNSLTPDSFFYRDLEDINYYQRIITEPKFKIEVPYQADLSNTKISISFIASFETKNEINYYSSAVSLVASSDLIINKEISDKTYLSVLFDDRFLLEQTPNESHQEEIYLSEVFYSLDQQNNFSANVFYNLENLFKSKVIFNNLTNYSQFNTYFKENYSVSTNCYLLKDEHTLNLAVNKTQDVITQNNNKYDSLSVYANSVDTIKFNNSFLAIDFTYNESSVKYITEIVMPFLDNLKNELINGINSSFFIQLLVYYKLVKETNSNPDSIKRISDITAANSNLLLNKDNLDSIVGLISLSQQKYIDAIRNIKTKNIANTKFSIKSEQPIDLYFTNAKINFIDITSTNSNFPIYLANDFKTNYSNEVTRFFGTTNLSIDGKSLDFNSLEISYSPKTISVLSSETYKNNFDFTKYISTPISDDELQSESYDFAKIFSYFNMNRQTKKYDFSKLLNENLASNNIVAEEVDGIKTIQNYTVTQKNNSLSYNSFPTGLRDDACIDTTNRQPTRNQINEEQTRNIPENLFNNLSVNGAFRDSNLYSNNYATLNASPEIPVQVLYPYTQFKNRDNTLFKPNEPVVANSKLFAAFYTNFKTIAKVEYMQQLTDGMFSVWKPLTNSVINNLATSQRIFCRFTFYHNSEFQILEQSFDEFSIYNRYFYIEA